MAMAWIAALHHHGRNPGCTHVLREGLRVVCELCIRMQSQDGWCNFDREGDAEGRGVLEQHKETWQKFVRAIASITEVKHA